MKEQQTNLKLTIDELKIESFVTSISDEMNMRLTGGFASHPTHTEVTDDEHHFCTTVIC